MNHKDFKELNVGKTVLVTGPSGSGKSEFAEILATKTDKSVIYLATAKVDLTDQEWQAKISIHQQRRPQTWQTVAVPTELSLYVDQAGKSECLLIDSLGTWITNLLELEPEIWQQEQHCFLTSLQNTQAQVILVGEETGWGVVPAYAMGRLFRDRLGKLSRQISNVVDTTYLVAGGYVLNLSELGEPLSNYEI